MIVEPSTLRGRLRPPPSKSILHRAIICASLAGGQSILHPANLSDDIRATLGAMAALTRTSHTFDGERLILRGGAGQIDGYAEIACGQSASTLRFIAPLALALSGGGAFTGSEQLGKRPLGPLAQICRAQDISFAQSNSPSLRIEMSGSLRAGSFAMPGDVSSQFASGLLLSLPLLGGDSSIRFDDVPQSSGYIRLTLDTLAAFGVHAHWPAPRELRIPGNQRYCPRDYEIEADFSQAAAFLCAGALGGDVFMAGLNPHSHQGDAIILKHLGAMGAEISMDPGGVSARGAELRAASFDAADCPDIAPILALAAVLSLGKTRITNARRLRYKECDRLRATVEILCRLGGIAREDGDEMVILGTGRLAGGCAIDTYGDHRMAMLAAIAALRCDAPIQINGGDCVTKSYPDFWRDYNALGGRAHV